MNDRHVDVILAGGGAAGLSLAYQLYRTLPELSLLIVDEAVERANDRTWCLWTREPSYLDGIAHRTWQWLSVVDDDRQMIHDLAPYRYVMVRANDFYRFMHSTLSASPRISLAAGTVDDMTDGPDGVEVAINGLAYSATWVFDSRYRSTESPTLTAEGHHLIQHFERWEIETDREVFDPLTPCLFDFRTPQLGAMFFVYILPYAATRGLVEYAVVSSNLLPPEAYQVALRDYIGKTLGATTYRIIREERDMIPMTNQMVPRRAGRRILNIGTRGGRVKASSGYAFHRIQQDSVAIAQSLKAHGHPFHLPEPRRRYHTYDSMLLHILTCHGGLGSAVFRRLFENNPIQRVFRFLDEEADLCEELRANGHSPSPALH